MNDFVFESLKELLKAEIILQPQPIVSERKKTFYYHLQEDQKEAKLKDVRLIVADPNRCLLINLDSGRNLTCKEGHPVVSHMSPLFNTSKGTTDHNCSCDYLCLYKTHTDKYVLFYIELKSRPSGTSFTRQFKSSICFVEYIKKILSLFYNCELTISQTHFLVFYYRQNATTPVGDVSISVSRPDDPLKIPTLNCKTAALKSLLTQVENDSQMESPSSAAFR